MNPQDGLLRPLEEQRAEYKKRRMIAMPIAGLIAWGVVGIGGLFLPTGKAALLLFVVVGSIAYLGMFVSKFTGEDFLDKTRPKNAFDGLFYQSMGSAIMVFAIAVPFYLVDKSSAPMSVGILTSLMWVQLGWIIQHWVGLAHAVVRTVLIVVAHYALPDYRYVAIPLVIVVLYAIAIFILEQRWREANRAA